MRLDVHHVIIMWRMVLVLAKCGKGGTQWVPGGPAATAAAARQLGSMHACTNWHFSGPSSRISLACCSRPQPAPLGKLHGR